MLFAVSAILAGCFLGGGESEEKEGKYETPTELRYESGLLQWHSTANSSLFDIELNGNIVTSFGFLSSYYIQSGHYTARVRVAETKQFYASDWTGEISFSVVQPFTLHYQDGSYFSESFETVAGDPYENLPIIQREGYEFLGWFSSQHGGVEITNGMPALTVQDFYARWKPLEFTLYFDNNGGEGESSKIIIFGSVLGSLPVPEKAGYFFGGWFSEDGATNIITSTPVNKTEDITVYARWLKEIEISFESENGNDSVLKTAIVSHPLPLHNAPQKTGYVFGGYFAKKGGEGMQIYSLNMSPLFGFWGEDFPTVLYAKWTPVTRQISFNRNGGTGGTAQAVAEFDSPMPSAEAPSRIGYTFMGYFVLGSNPQLFYYDKDMVSLRDWDRPEISAFSYVLHAHWQVNTYGISLVVGEGAPLLNNEHTVEFNQHYTLEVPQERYGYIFGGWWTSAGGGTQFTNENGVSLSAWNRTSGITLYAIWMAQRYTLLYVDSGIELSHTVTFNPNYEGALLPYFTQTVTLFEGLKYHEPRGRTGYIFAGWYTTELLNIPFNFNATVSGDITVYAKWISYDSSHRVLDIGRGSGGFSFFPSSSTSQWFVFVPLVTQYIRIVVAVTTGVSVSAFIHDAEGFASRPPKPFATYYSYTQQESINFLAVAGSPYYLLVSSGGGVTQGSVSISAEGNRLPNDGGKAQPTTSRTATFGWETPLISWTPVRAGFSFGGYFTEPNGEGEMFYDSQRNPVKNIWDFEYHDIIIPLYAKWT
ncbi:MAG: InlB B-repeat-containing protein [Firmicutes bacterium]|nr:InlB B-repeat-containing protein [Bacillota bacterium]